MRFALVVACVLSAASAQEPGSALLPEAAPVIADDATSPILAGGVECTLCTDAVRAAESEITSPAVIKQLTTWSDELCAHVPLNLTSECDTLVADHLSQVVGALVSKVTPEAACALVRACPAGAPAAEPSSAECSLCEAAVTAAERKITSPEDVQALSDWVKGVCGDVPASLAKQCRSFVDEYIGPAVDALVAKATPSGVCGRLRMCAGAEEEAADDFAHLPDVPAEIARATPQMASLFALAKADPAKLAALLAESPLAAIAEPVSLPAAPLAADADATPIVVAHGMGDSCFNPGMKSVTQAAGQRVGAYSTCIPTGSSQSSDTINGFLMSMDKSVDVFAQKVKADPKLANGFNAFGLSQGNNVIRGYITKYNDPPVKTFMSICGINAGVGAFPQCSPDIPVVGAVCKALAEVLGEFAYLEFFQKHLFQADYYRDPARLNASAYLDNSELAAWNGDKAVNEQYKANYAKTDQFVWVKGTEDTVVWPREGEWFGDFDPTDPWKKTVAYTETRWYKEDTFGLQTADKAGKNHFESFKGNHIRFTEDELFAWLDKYFK